MIQFKPVLKTGEIKVMAGNVTAGRIAQAFDRTGTGKIYVQNANVGLEAPDLIRVLRQMGVALQPGIEAKIETAVAAQEQVASAARAIRLGKRAKPRKSAAVKPAKTVKAKPKAKRA